MTFKETIGKLSSFAMTDSRHFRIARNMMVICFFVFVGKLAGAFKEMIIAYQFGVSDLIDQYVFVNTWVNLIPAIWVSVSTAAFVPVARKMNRGELEDFSSQVSGMIVVCCVLFTILMYLGLPVLIDSLALTFNTVDNPELLTWIRGLAPLCGGGLLVGFYSAQLLTQEHHANTLAEGIPALFIAGIVLAWPIGSVTQPLIVGSLVGLAMHVAFLYVLLRRNDLYVASRYSLASPEWVAFRRALGLLVLGKIITSFVAPIDQAIAAGIGSGSIATLNYGNRLTGLFVGLGVTAIGRAILPILSERGGQPAEIIRVAKYWSYALFSLGMVFVVVGWVFGEWIVATMFERGAFGREDTIAVVEVFRFGLLQLPFFFASIVLVQLFASFRIYWILLVTSITTIIVKAGMGIVLAEHFGVPGLALSTGCMYLVNCLVLLYGLKYCPVKVQGH